MPKEAMFTLKLEPELRAQFMAAAQVADRPASQIVREFMRDFIQRQCADLGHVLSVLRAHGPALRKRGVARLWVFGSTARGEARADSDIDLLAEFDPDAKLSLVGLSSLRADLSDLLGAPADLVERGTLRPTVGAAAEREAVRVW